MKAFWVGLCLTVMAGAVSAEPLTFKDARKALPRAGERTDLVTFPERLPASDAAKFEAVGQTLDQVFKQIGATLTGYGAVAISPDEGLVVNYLSGVSNFHSTASANAAAIDYCNGKKKAASQSCVVVAEVRPRGASDNDALTLSAAANKSLRGDYRKLKAPKAFAISPSTGAFGFDRGDGSRALAICAQAGARDCKIAVAD